MELAAASHTVTNQTELFNAITTVEEGGFIVLGNPITLIATFTIPAENSKSFTIDLNGNTLNSGNKTAIRHNGSVIISGGTVKNTNGMGISQLFEGDITVSSGRVEAKRQAINLNNKGKITISGTPVISSNNEYYTIGFDHDEASLEITGGTVENTHERGTAITAWQRSSSSMGCPWKPPFTAGPARNSKSLR